MPTNISADFDRPAFAMPDTILEVCDPYTYDRKVSELINELR